MHSLLEHGIRRATAPHRHRLTGVQPHVVKVSERSRVNARVLTQSNHRVEVPHHEQGRHAHRTHVQVRRLVVWLSGCLVVWLSGCLVVWSRVPSSVCLVVRLCRVLYLAMSPDGQTIVTGAGDETLRFWNVFPGPKSKDTASAATSLLFPSGADVR